MDLLRFGRLFNKGSQERGYEMKSLFAVAASMLIASPALAQVKPCEELKSEIETKIKNNGVNAFTLTIVGKDAAEDSAPSRLVGRCRRRSHQSELEAKQKARVCGLFVYLIFVSL